MVNKKSFLIYLLAMFLIIPAFLMLSACGKKTFSYLDVKFSNQSSSIACHYGDNAGLDSFEITAHFSDDSTEILSLQNVTVKIEFCEGHYSNPIEIELSSYLEKIESNTLDVGTYTIDFTYIGSTVSLTAEVYAVANTLDYELDLTTNVNSMGGKTIEDNNVIFYGTKTSAVDLTVMTDNKFVSNSQIDGLYILMKKVDGYDDMIERYNVKDKMPDQLLSPQEYEQNNLLSAISFEDDSNNLSEITPGQYLICAKIKETNNFFATYSSFQKIEILKAPFTIENENLTSENYDTYNGLQYTWAFDVEKRVSKDVTFNDMLANEENNYYHTNDYFSSGEFSLMLKAGQQTAQEQISLNNLVSGEEYENNLSKLLKYGNFVAVPFEGETALRGYNAQQNGEQLTAKVKFVPNEDYQNLYEESEPFLIKLTVNKGSYLIPRPTVSTNKYECSPDSITPSVLTFENFDYITQFCAEKPDSLTVSYKPEDYNKWQFSAVGAGTYTTTIYFAGNDTAKDIVNFYWEEDKTISHGSTYNVEYVKETIGGTEYIIGVKYIWEVKKEEFNDLREFIHNENGFSLQLNEKGEAIIMFGHGPDEYYEGLQLTWSVLEKGFNLDGYGTTSATGTLTDVPGKEGNCRYKKFTINTDGLENSSVYNIGFTITNVASDNFGTINAESIIVTLAGYSYYQDENSNICKSFNGTTTNNTPVYAKYRLFTTVDTLKTVLESLNKITGTNGSWTIKNADNNTTISDYSTSLSNASKFKFVFTSKVCYIKNDDFIIHFFDHEPNANEFDIASE